MTQTPASVLICGAGPTGLMTACQLALRDIPFRIIDKSASATTQSRALVIHARTLEIFKQMGVAEKILELGEICRGVTWVFNGKETAHIKIVGDNLTEFPYVFCLEQSKTEETLINFLKERGHEVERQVELVDYTKTNRGVTAQLKKSDGSIETMNADYLIGADGAHSIVRERMHLNLDGSTYLQTLFVIDCQVKANIRPNEIYLIMSEVGLIGLFPMIQSHANEQPGCSRYRVLGVLPAADKDKVVTFEDIQKNFSERIAMPGEIFDAAWISTYHAHHRHAKTFREDCCFIIGDAAHIHSPVGGQGMNTGLQDAYNLVWKLALVIQGKANDVLLDTFNTERMAVAEKLVKSTDKVFYMVASESVWMKNFRLHVLPQILCLVNFIINHVTYFAQKIFSIISQIGIKYPDSTLSKNVSYGNFCKNTPAPGDRFPFVFYQENSQQKNIQNLLQGVGFHCVIFSKKNDDTKKSLLTYLQQKENFIQVHEIAYHAGTESLYRMFDMHESGYYLIRPDMYIACRVSTLKVEPLKTYLSVFLKK